jgi:quercetin dioxygenase-like cupin family protein
MDAATKDSELIVDVGQGRLFHALGSPVERLIHPLTVGSNQLGVSIVTLAPKGEVIRHRHDYEEAYYVIAGVGSMYLEGVGDFDLMPGRAVYIPASRIHGQVNTSDDEELSILCALSPPPVEGQVPELFPEDS